LGNRNGEQKDAYRGYEELSEGRRLSEEESGGEGRVERRRMRRTPAGRESSARVLEGVSRVLAARTAQKPLNKKNEGRGKAGE